jgi:hypothetical protein
MVKGMMGGMTAPFKSVPPVILALVGIVILVLLVSIFTPILAVFGQTTFETEIFVEDSLIGTVSGEIILNQDEYATAWKPDSGQLLSESISIDTWKATYDVSGLDLPLGAFGWGIGITAYHYELYINNQLHTRGSDHVGGGDLDHDDTQSTLTFTGVSVPAIFLEGEFPDGSVATMRMVANVSALYLQPIPPDIVKTNHYINIVLAEYSSKLVSGKGFVQPDSNLPYEEGTELRFVLETGNSGGHGWTVTIHPPLSRTDLQKVIYTGDGFSGQDNFGPSIVSWDIPIGWFTLSGDNQCRITIANELFEGVLTTWWVVDDIGLIPEPDPGNPTGVIEDVNGPMTTGSTMTMTLSAIPNEITQAPISYFVVYVYYGVPEFMPGTDFIQEFIIFDGHFNADTNGRATVNFIIPSNKPGQISIRASAVDNLGRSSAIDTWSGIASDIQPIPPTPDPIEYPFIWTLGAIIGALILIVGLTLIIVFVPTPFSLRIIIALIFAGIMAFIVWWLGTHPGGLI